MIFSPAGRIPRVVEQRERIRRLVLVVQTGLPDSSVIRSD
jgi:hypothetical protein